MPIPTFSIVIPLFNKASTIQRTVQSVLSQTVEDFELIIVDGHSTDGSYELVSGIEDSRITLLKQNGKGVSSARNQGIDYASSELIALLDADDEWYPDFLETLLHLYQTYPGAGIYATAYERCAITTCKPSPLNGLPKKWEGYLPSYFKTYVESGYPPFCPSCLALTKNILGKVGAFNPTSRMSEDLELWTKIALISPIVFTTEIHSRYHLYAENKGSTNYHPIKQLPPVTYLSQLPENELMSRNDAEYIQLSIEYQNLIVAYLNIGAGCKKYAKSALSKSKSKRFIVKRWGLRCLTYLPVFISKRFIVTYADIPYIIDKVKIMFSFSK